MQRLDIVDDAGNLVCRFTPSGDGLITTYAAVNGSVGDADGRNRLLGHNAHPATLEPVVRHLMELNINQLSVRALRRSLNWYWQQQKRKDGGK